MSPQDFELVNAAALDNVLSLLRSWFPNGVQENQEYKTGDLADVPGKSLSVNTVTGKWSDFATAVAGGDLISLRAAQLGVVQGEAMKEIAAELGMRLEGGARTRGARGARSGAGKTHGRKRAPDWRSIVPAPNTGYQEPRRGDRRPDQIWTYPDQDGALLFQVCRFDKPAAKPGEKPKKDFFPWCYGELDGAVGWHFKHPDAPRPLYGLRRLAQWPKAPVLVVEGEKAADAAQGLLGDAVVVMSWPAGARAADKADWSPLKGRRCFLWPDADEPGQEAMAGWTTGGGTQRKGVADLLRDVGVAEVKLVALPMGVAEGWDLADGAEQGWDGAKLTTWIKDKTADPPVRLDDKRAARGTGRGPPPGDLHDPLDHPDCPVTVLGQRGMTVFYLDADRQLVELAAREHGSANVEKIFAGDLLWLGANFYNPSQRKGDAPYALGTLRSALFAAAKRAGRFDPNQRVRAMGAWRLKDGALLLHCGDRLWTKAGFQPAGCLLEGHVYPKTDRVPAPAEIPATAELGAELLDFVESWIWLGPPAHGRRGKDGEIRSAGHLAARLWLGWIVCGVICGALAWRPHITVTGDYSTGKSKLFALMKDIVGGRLLESSDPTEAGIRQELAGAARPVAIDEIENKANGERGERVIGLSRLGSTDGQAPVLRGSAEGKASGWYIRACFYFSAVLPPPLEPQDASRNAVLSLGMMPPGDSDVALSVEQRITHFAGLSERFIGRIAEGYERFAENLMVYRMALMDVGAESRQCDQFGRLLAGADILLRDRASDPEEAAAMVHGLLPSDLVPGREDGGPQSCLIHLLSTAIDQWPEKGGRVRGSLGALVGFTFKSPVPANKRLLGSYGLAIKHDEANPARRFLVVANKHRGIDQIFQGTKWQNGLWRVDLLRLPSAHVDGKAVFFAGATSKGVWIEDDDLPPHEDPEEVEERERYEATRAEQAEQASEGFEGG